MELPRRRDTTSSRQERKLPDSTQRRHGSGIDQNKGPRRHIRGTFILQSSRGQLMRKGYGTDNVIVWLLVSLPEVAVTVMV
jgi:hypothetical protein